MVKPTSEYFYHGINRQFKKESYKGHLPKAINSFNAILMVQPGPTLETVKKAFVKVQDRIEAYSNSIERLFTALMNEEILSEQVTEEERIRIEEYHKQLLKLQCQIETDFVKFNSNYEASNDGSIVSQVSAHSKISDSPKPIIRLTALEPPCWSGLKADFYTWKKKFTRIMAEAQISDDLTQLCYLQKPKIIPSEYQTLITDCLTLYEAWERLEERVPKETIKYEILAQFKRLKPLPSKRSPSILREFANEISLFCRHMADLGLASDNYSCIIMQDVYEHLEQDTALRYRSRIQLKRELGILVTEDLDSLVGFIRSEATTLELSASFTIPGPATKSAFPGKSVNVLYNPENIAGTKHDS